ncbi:MAG TPA: hypothetical protein VEK08_23790 [Planctomycetota bacterium]|nr:hypothetical protein [Planctomycetota bacterium]
MKTLNVREAQKQLPKWIKRSKKETIALTDDAGRVVGMLAAVNEEDIDDLLVETPAFKEMIQRSRESLKTGTAVSAQNLLKEFKRTGQAKRRK